MESGARRLWRMSITRSATGLDAHATLIPIGARSHAHEEIHTKSQTRNTRQSNHKEENRQTQRHFKTIHTKQQADHEENLPQTQANNHAQSDNQASCTTQANNNTQGDNQASRTTQADNRA